MHLFSEIDLRKANFQSDNEAASPAVTELSVRVSTRSRCTGVFPSSGTPEQEFRAASRPGSLGEPIKLADKQM